jgi:hypothetical protein
MEQFFADVYYEVASARSRPAFEVFIELLRLYAAILAETTNWMSKQSRTGALGRFLRGEIERAGTDRLTLITFNQDLVIENAIQRLYRRPGVWCLQALYGDIGAIPVSYGPRSVIPAFEHHHPGCLHLAPVRLLKLHGSLNWGLRTTTPNPRAATIFPADLRRSVFLLNTRTVIALPAIRTRAVGRKGRERWYWWPLVVPPIYEKQRVTGIDLLQGLWTQAREAIEQAERVTLVGYSLPDADIGGKQMLRRAFATNTALDGVDCVNPDAGMTPKIVHTLGCKAVRLYSDLDSYARLAR